MTVLALLPLLILVADEAPKNWTKVSDSDGLTVYSVPRAGSNVAEMKVEGMIDAPPHVIWKGIRDYANYAKNQPYTEEGKVMETEGGDKVIYFYSVVNAPLVDRRDYCIRVLDESKWDDGKGFLMMTWKETDKCPPPKAGLVRVKSSDGYWRLEPRENGTKTFATYVIYTDPAGSIPQWIVNQGNRTTVVNIFQATRKAAVKAQAAAPR